VTSMARASKNDEEPAGPYHSSFISVSWRLPAGGGSVCISIAPSATLLRNQLCL